MGNFETYKPKNVEEARIAIVVARFNSDITDELLNGAKKVLFENSVKEDNVNVIYVPGSMELAIAAKASAENNVDAIICLGAVVRGGTPHFEYVANTCALAISNVALNTGIPCIFGVLTVDNQEQAKDRIGGKEGHKGEEAALSALEMIEVLRSMKSDPSKKITGFVS